MKNAFSLTQILSKNNLTILFLALVAGFLISVYNFSVILLLIFAVFLWFILEKFEMAVLLLIFYLPFQVALNMAAGFDVASGRVLILLFFVIWIFRSLKNKKLEVDFSLETFFIILFLFLAAFSFSEASEIDRAIRKFLVFCSVFPLYFVVTSFIGDRKFILRAIKYIFVGGFILSLFGVLQFLAQFVFGINPLFDFSAKVIAPIFYGNTFGSEVVSNPSWLVNVAGATLLRAFSIFPDPHIFSFYLGMVIPLSFAFLFLDKKQLDESGIFGGKKLVFIIFSVLIAAELLTFSRGGYLGMAASFFVMVILFWRYFTSLQKKLLITFFVAGAAFLSFTNSSVLTRFLSSFDVSEGSNMERMKNWQQGWNEFSNNFLGGVGIGNYSFYLDPTLDYRVPVYAHNLYLDLGAELGVFALLAWISLIAVTIRELYKASNATSDKTISYIALGLIGSLVWYSAHSFFDTSIYAPNILSMFVVILSLSALVVRYVKMESE